MLSEVPAGWSGHQPLANYAENITRKWNGRTALPYVGLEHIKQAAGQLEALGSSASISSAKNLFESGDILFGKLRPNLRKYWKADREGICSTDILVLRAKNDVLPEFLYAVIQSEPFLAFAENDAAGTKMPRTSWNRLATVELAVPPLPEQKRIAEILSSIDESIQATQSVIDQAERVKKGLMEDLLTGGLGSEAIAKGEVPEGWLSTKQGEIATFINGRAFKLSEWRDDGVPVIRLQNLTGSGKAFYYSDLQLPEHQYCQHGDLLYMWSASFGAYIWQGGRAIFHYHIWKVEQDSSRLLKQFHFYLLQYYTEIWKSSADGMAMLHLTKKGMEQLEIAIPSLPEQKRIAEILSSVDDFIQNQRKMIERYQVIKKGLMDDLLTGRVRTV